MKLNRWFYILVLAALLLSSCTSAATEAPQPVETEVAESPEPAPSTDVALKITGLVTQEVGWTEAEVLAMEAMTIESTNKNGETKSYTGVSINALLALAGVSPTATKIVFVADDGYTAEVSLVEVQACTDCIISFRSQGGLFNPP